MRCAALRFLLVTLTGAGCGSESQTEAPASEAVHGESSTLFAVADFLKPRMDGATDLDPYLAPLIYLEVPHDAPLGSARVNGANELAVDAGEPVVYYSDRLVDLDGRERRQVTFLWFRAGPTPKAQGIRLLFDREGLPVLFQVLADSGGRRPVYVTQALEERAAEAFGPALAGRAFAIEAATTEPVVLAGTVASSPAALGSFVYQARGESDIATLHCRCSPTQVGEIGETIEYELMPLELLDGVWPLGGEEDFPPPAVLARSLRLPEGF